MTTYNYRLYEVRTGLNFSRRKMAKALRISTFYYRLLENGYLKPNKKAIEKISSFLGEDYSVYLQGEASNPADLPEKEGKLAGFLYKIAGKIWVRIIFIVLTLGCLGITISGFVVESRVQYSQEDYYDASYIAFANEVREKGSSHVTILDSFIVPEIDANYIDEDTGEYKYIEIIGHKEDDRYLSLRFRAIYRNAEARLTASISEAYFGEGIASVSFDITYYDHKKGRDFANFTLYNDKDPENLIPRDNPDSAYNLAVIKAGKILKDFETLIDDKMTSTLKVPELLSMQKEANLKMAGISAYGLLASLLGFILTGVFLFATIFVFLYGKGKEMKEIRFAPDKPHETIFEEGRKPLKKDIRFSPFIPETILELFGIGLLFLAIIVRLSGYVFGFFGSISLGTYLNSEGANQAMGMFILGLFLLYFLDFDIFLEDRRVIRNIFLYGIIFICLYFLEATLMSGFSDGSVIGNLTTLIPLPNMFSSISCYFMITFFLFYTPKVMNTKTKLIVFRCLAILPIAWIIVSWIIYKGNGVFFNLNLNVWGLFIFNGERLPFSVLAISYLVLLYFLRLFYEHRYGKNNAQIYFNSNRFLWQKNILTAIIILLVALTEFLLRDNQTAIKMDIGSYWQLWVLAPILLFYHPHKGPRNKGVDYTITGLYMITLVIAYITIALLALFSLAGVA